MKEGTRGSNGVEEWKSGRKEATRRLKTRMTTRNNRHTRLDPSFLQVQAKMYKPDNKLAHPIYANRRLITN
ncbi:hypothetical protein E2C01_068249 [Portunus trituberculatus]|uniref:Uncharacterized protein n=1 Tax=Portunus trituberculatus TaxID=210409 RepID=A0A5B7HXE3_PORTR|nr:hypothetical protein [Portunus trituberculatus]